MEAWQEDQDFLALLRECAACVVQSHWRGWLVRQQLLQQRRAAASIQRTWRKLWPAQQARAAAARTLQRTWRAYRCRQAFLQLQRFVAAAESADPRQVLAALAQRAEAEVADAAAGVKVRLRLDGTACPPVLVFAVVTHRPVVHLGTPASAACAQQPSLPQWCRAPQELFGRGAAKSTRAAAPARRLPAPDCEGTQVMREHPGAARKRRRRRQLLQLYQEGRQLEETPCVAAASGVEGHNAQESSAAHTDDMEAAGSGSEDGQEGEELLVWSSLLGFEEYRRGWLHMGASVWSDAS